MKHAAPRLTTLRSACHSLSDATDAALCPTREELGLPEHAFVLACFAPPHTLCPRTWELFCAVLGAAPRAILCVACAAAAAAATAAAEQRLP